MWLACPAAFVCGMCIPLHLPGAAAWKRGTRGHPWQCECDLKRNWRVAYACPMCCCTALCPLMLPLHACSGAVSHGAAAGRIFFYLTPMDETAGELQVGCGLGGHGHGAHVRAAVRRAWA